MARVTCLSAAADPAAVPRGVSGKSLLVHLFHEFVQPRPQVGAEVVTVDGELHNGLDVVETVPGIVATATEDHAVDPAGLLRVDRHFLQGVRQLDLVALAGSGVLKNIENLWTQYVAPDDGEVGRGLLRAGLFDEAGNANDIGVVGGLDG